MAGSIWSKFTNAFSWGVFLWISWGVCGRGFARPENEHSLRIVLIVVRAIDAHCIQLGAFVAASDDLVVEKFRIAITATRLLALLHKLDASKAQQMKIRTGGPVQVKQLDSEVDLGSSAGIGLEISFGEVRRSRIGLG